MGEYKLIMEPVRYNYLAGGDRYFLLTGKTGCPSANFKVLSGGGVIVSDAWISADYLPGK